MWLPLLRCQIVRQRVPLLVWNLSGYRRVLGDMLELLEVEWEGVSVRVVK